MKVKNNIKFNELLLTLAKMPIILGTTPKSYNRGNASPVCTSIYTEYWGRGAWGSAMDFAMNQQLQMYISAYALSYPNLPSCSFPRVQPIIYNKYFTIDESSWLLMQDKLTFTEYFVLHDLTSYIIAGTYKQKMKHRNKQRLQGKLKNQFIKIKL